MIASAHQPNFFPWLGYFTKADKADIFVFLDEVQFPRTGKGNWVNRVKTLSTGMPVWWTCPVSRAKGVQLISEVRMANNLWQEKTLRSLRASYSGAPYFKEMFAFISSLVTHDNPLLANFNMHAIQSIAGLLGITTTWLRQSDLKDDAVRNLRGSARLAAICTEVKADTYLAGDGADGYEQPREYEKYGITLTRNSFSPSPYPQRPNMKFIPGLSIIDALFHTGPVGTLDLIRQK